MTVFDDDDPPLDEDAPTPKLCLACGGNHQLVIETDRGHRMQRCRWCTRGAMNEAQFKRWLKYREEHKK